MKYLTLIFGLLFFSVLSADGHLKSEKDVLASLQKYFEARNSDCLLYTSPSPRDYAASRMPSSA